MQVGGVIESDVLLPAAAVHALDLRVAHLAGLALSPPLRRIRFWATL